MKYVWNFILHLPRFHCNPSHKVTKLPLTVHLIALLSACDVRALLRANKNVLEIHLPVMILYIYIYIYIYISAVKVTSHWCLVMSFWLKVCIYSHTRGVKLGLGLGFMQTSQVLPHWLNQSFSFWTLSYTQRHCHVRIEKGPVQTLRFVLIEITKVVKPVH